VLVKAITQLPRQFPSLDDNQLAAAQSAALALGVGMQGQRIALTDFVHSLNATQLRYVQAIQVKVLACLMAVIAVAEDTPSPALLRFIASRSVESDVRADAQSLQAKVEPEAPVTVMKPNAVAASVDNGNDDDNDLVKKTILNLLPLVDNTVVCLTVLPALDANLLNTTVVTEVDFLRSLAKRVFGRPSKLPRDVTREFISNLVVAFGEKQLNDALFNPIAFAFSLLGETESHKLIANITQASVLISPLSPTQVPAAQQLVVSIDSPMNITRNVVQQFLSQLSPLQNRIIATLRQSTMLMLANAMTASEGVSEQNSSS